MKARTISERLVSTFGMRRPVSSIEVVRRLCVEAVSDVPSDSRNRLLMRLDCMRRADDFQYVRSALFDVISRFHGEGTARERVAALDVTLGWARPLP